MFEDYLEKVIDNDHMISVTINKRQWKVTIVEFKELWEGKIPVFFKSYYRGSTLTKVDELTYKVTE